MKWPEIVSAADLEKIREQSFTQPQVIFKHSTRCSISAMALNRMVSASQPANCTIHYLDLIQYRPLSNQIATDYNVQHESPQMLLIKNGQCVYHASHSDIRMNSLEAHL